MWLRIAANCASAIRVDTLVTNSTADPLPWLREHVDAFCSAGARGPLYVFIRQAPDAEFAEVLRGVTLGQRLQPNVIAEASALGSRAQLQLLESVGVHALYVTLHGATAATHDARAGEPGSWRRALLLLTTAPQVCERMRVGAHLMLSPDTAEDVPAILRLVRKASSSELLLWDAGCNGIDHGLEPAAALRALDSTLSAAHKLRLRICPVGFERTRTAAAPIATHAAMVSGAVVELLRDGVPLPSAAAGLLATEGTAAPIADAAPTGWDVRQIACEFAAGGRPLLDLPACLGGPPPELGIRRADGTKVDACRHCPIDARCSGVPPPLLNIPGLPQVVRPPRHWIALPERARVLVLSPVVSDVPYGATFFSLARSLAAMGARVDVVTPWAMHAEIIPSSFTEPQRPGRPGGASAVETFIADGPVDQYDLVITPEPKTTHPLAVSGRIGEHTRLAVTDFHMLGGIDWWARDLCAPGSRPEEGGWWPSDQVVLYSAFPGYGRLYTRYGVPMCQVAWQPFALEPSSFPVACAAIDGTFIISGGNHRRDVETLLAAAARLSNHIHPIDLFAEGQLTDVPPQVRFRGAVPTADFCPAVGQSRFMVVPLLEDPYNAAGITAMATAIMCGRPLVATASPAARDYVSDGVNGLLVPPGDPQAMAEAIELLDTDATLLAALAAGARDMAAQLTAEAWARALLHGSRTYEEGHWMWTKWRARRS